MYGLPTRKTPPPFGTGCPSSTTRGLAETPYRGSMPDMLPEQLASKREPTASAATVPMRIATTPPTRMREYPPSEGRNLNALRPKREPRPAGLVKNESTPMAWLEIGIADDRCIGKQTITALLSDS
jgi:hypothetical protein